MGKSSSATCILKNYGYLIYEFNASDIRTKTQVEQSLYNLINIKQARGRSPIAIIMDEIDGGDKGGLTELIKYINPNRGKGNRKKEDQEKLLALPPIICICNNVNEKKLQDLRKDCLELHFKTPNNQDLHELLDRICQAEHLNIEPEAAELVIEYSQGDFRRLITYLQSIDSLLIDNNLVLGVDEIEQCNYIIGEKSMDMDLAEGVRYLLTTKNLDPEFSLKLYQNHKSQYICSIYENYVNLAINQGSNKNMNQVMKKIKTMEKVIDDISWSDMVDKIMHKNQLFYLHRVHGLLSCHLPSMELYNDEIFRLQYSSSWSKFNLQKCNEKDIYNLASKLKTSTGGTDVQLLSQITLHHLLDSDETFEEGIKLLKGYGLDYNHIKTLVKIDRLTKHKKYTAKMERIVKEHFPVKSSGDFIKKKKRN